MTTVLVIEDDDDMAELLRRALTGDGFDCERTASGHTGLAMASRLRPDVVLLDLDLPDADGLELLPMLKELAPVIVLTGRHSDDAIIRGLHLGAEDYVTKPFSPRVLLARIAVAARRERTDGPERIERGSLVIDLVRRVATVAGEIVELTRRELDLLAHLAERPGTVVTREELLAAVWHSSAEWQGAATVTEHVRRIRVKLGDPGWIENVRGVGYRFSIPA